MPDGHASQEIEAALDRDLALDASKGVRLEGEDGLLDWPGAEGPVLRERDLYLAHCVWAAAVGAEGAAPALVRAGPDSTQWRYAMPMRTSPLPAAAAPAGAGVGQYSPVTDAATVVAVVGTVHVKGIVEALASGAAATVELNRLV